jgi:surfeit locus 1 family protein
LKIAAREFAPAWWATLATLAGVALTVALGFWQLGRADTKLALQMRIDTLAKEAPLVIGAQTVNVDDVLLRRVQVRGRFEPRHVVFIDNRVHKHQAGYHVLMPLRIAGEAQAGGEKYVLVNRGWVAAGSERKRAPAVKTPEGEVVVSGMATPPGERFLELSSQVAEGNIWQNMVLARYRQATKLDVQPVIIQQTSTVDDGLVRDWPPADLKRNTHLAYAVQWFALAAAIFIYYVVINVRRKSRTDAAVAR